MFGKIQMAGIDYLAEAGVSTFDKSVLLSLLGLAKYNGLIFASQREIAEYANSHPANVNKAIKRLIAYGFISRIENGLKIEPTFCQFGKCAE